MFALGLVGYIWGTTWIASQARRELYAALQLAGIRQFTAGSIYVIYFLLKGHPLFNEKVSIYIAAGGAIALCGVYLVNETFG